MPSGTLCYDIGGTHIRAIVFDPAGHALAERIKEETPHRARPKQTMALLKLLSKQLPRFDRIAAGFPGVVKSGHTWSATNLGPGWIGFPFRAALERLLHAPARIANDADVQGMAAISGKGIELVLTLGTGLGSALFHDGILLPNLQLGHVPFEHGGTYEDLLGHKGLSKWGDRSWNHHLRKAVASLAPVFNWDHLYLGGGEAKKIRGRFPKNVHVVSNELGLLGGLELWKQP